MISIGVRECERARNAIRGRMMNILYHSFHIHRALNPILYCHGTEITLYYTLNACDNIIYAPSHLYPGFYLYLVTRKGAVTLHLERSLIKCSNCWFNNDTS